MKKIFIAISTLVLATLTLAPVSAQQIQYIGYNVSPVWDTANNTTNNFSVVQGQTLNVIVGATDNNGDVLTYAAVRLPDNASFNGSTRVLTFSPSFNQLGSFPVLLSVTDNKSQPVTKTFYVNVMSGSTYYRPSSLYPDDYYVNDAPYFTATQSYYTVNSHEVLTFQVRATDPDSDPVRYAATGLPSGAVFNSVTGQFSWTPATGQRGVYSVVFSANDGRATSSPFTVTIVVDGGIIRSVINDVNGVNIATYTAGAYNVYGNSPSTSSIQPYFTTTPTTSVYPGQTFLYDARAVAANGGAVVYTSSLGQSGSFINASTGRVSWVVPSTARSGQQYQFILVATDASGRSATQGFTLTVAGFTTAAPATYTYAQPAQKSTIAAAPTFTAAVPVTYAAAVPTYSGNYAMYYPGETVLINTGRTIPTLPITAAAYGTNYAANIYDTMGQNALHAFNVAVRTSDKGDMIVSWDTNRQTKAEVVYGYTSHARSDAWNMILNYDFTTGEMNTISTKHEISLGKLQIGRTYYMRAISRDSSQTDISREIVFIPMDAGQPVPQYEGAASALSTTGNFLTSGIFLGLLGLIVLALIVYVSYLSMLASRRNYELAAVPELHIDDHAADAAHGHVHDAAHGNGGATNGNGVAHH